MNRIPCPSESWDAYSEGQEFPDDLCFNCLCKLPEEDPDPANGGDSPWQEGFCSEECRKRIPVPRDEDKLKELDAYGHLTWTVGYSDECNQDDRGDWLACFDFLVWKHPSRGVLIAYEVTVNSDSGGFIESPDRGVVPADKAPTGLPDYWAGIGMDDGTPWTLTEIKESWEVNDRWNAALGKAISEAASLPSDREVG